jgi:hypothetical protein
VTDVLTPTSGLWRPVALTDALIASPGADVAADALGELRTTLVRDLSALVADLPSGDELVLDGYRLRMAAYDPERCAAEAAFVPSPRVTRRAVGIVAVDRFVRGRSPAPATAVAEILSAVAQEAGSAPRRAGADGSRPPWWAEWYCGLGPGGRAVVEAEAVTWATQLSTALQWERFQRPPVIGGRDDWWACPGARRLTLKGRADVRALVGGRQALLVVSGGVPTPGWRIDLGFPALVAALVRGERGVPVRVVGTWPSCGQFRALEVDAGVLVDAARAVVSAVGTWVDAMIERRGPRQVP